MQFLYPGVLWALAALAVPVIIHLFNFRRYKTVYFSNVKFLREVKQETTSRSRLKHLLVLASRLLAVAFLVLAFAQPFIPNKKNSFAAGRKAVSVFIDNSFSMNAVSNNRSLLEQCKLAAKELARNYAADDQFQLLTNDFEGRHQRLVGREEFLTMVDEVETSPAVRSLSEISQRQKEALSRENSGNRTAYLLSDFQKNMGGFQPDSSVQYNLVPVQGEAAANVYIDTVWFTGPVQLLHTEAQLIVKLTNAGDQAKEDGRLVMKLNGQTKAMADFKIAASSFIYDTLRFLLNDAGWNRAELSVQDYPITFDDNYFIAFQVTEKIKVLVVNESRPNVFLEALFNNQPEFEYTPVNADAFDPALLSGKQLVILQNLKSISAPMGAAINAYLTDGGVVAVFPGEKCDMPSYNRFLNNLRANSITGFSEQAQDLAAINLQQNIFRDVFVKVPQNISLPRALKYYTFTHSTASDEEVILSLKDGGSFFSRYPCQSGSLYVAAAPLNKEFTELPVHAIFVPMLYKMALESSHGGNIAYFIGDKTRMEADAKKVTGEKVYRMKGDNLEFIPEQFNVGNKVLLGLNTQIKKAGFYRLSIENADTSQWVALNFDRKESDLKFITAAELTAQYPLSNVSVVNGKGMEAAAVVKELDRGTPLWKWFIVLALLALGAEVLLLRLWKA